MLNCSPFHTILNFSRSNIDIQQIKSCALLDAAPQDKAQLNDLGQFAPLVVTQYGKDTYHLLDGDRIYAAMMDLYNAGDQRFAVVDCLIVDSEKLSESFTKLIIQYRAIELGLENKDAHRLHWIDTLLRVAEEQNISPSKVVALVSDLLHQSTRYARMYVTIAADAVPEVRKAVITPASRRREKSPHIPVEQAARIAGLSPDQQRAELAKVQTALTAKKATGQTARQKSVQAWLSSMEKQLGDGATLAKYDRELLEKASQLWVEFNSASADSQQENKWDGI